MDRRTLLAAGIAAPVALSLPALAIPMDKSVSRVVWGTGAWSSPHGPLVSTWIHERWFDHERKPVLISGEHYMNDLLTLNDPYFAIQPFHKIFSVQKGWINDPDGLEILIRENGVALPPLRIGSTHGLNLDPGDPHANMYFVRNLFLRWDDPVKIALENQIAPDLSLFESAIKQINDAKAEAKKAA